MYWTKETLLDHLPFLYRQRDAEIAAREGLPEGPLASLMGVLAEQIAAVEGNIDQLYANWFVETCEPWVLPYLGKLLGIDRLPHTESSVHTGRAYIANTMAYRRRKGTPGMLEQLARDTTGWHARVVEYFFHLVQFQHLNRYRPDEWLTPDLRDLEPLEKLRGPFTEVNRLPEIRTVDAPLPGRFNIPNIGLHLWPLKAYAPPDATGTATVPFARFAIEARPEAFPAAEGDPVARWFLHPLGWTLRLFNRPLSRDPSSGATVTSLAGERDVPDPLRRLPLHREVEALRQSIADGAAPPESRYLGSQRPVLQLFADEELVPIPSEEIRIVDFSHGWPQPDATESYLPDDGGAPVALPIRVAVDPVRGQVAFAPGAEPGRLRAVYAYGFTMDLGGGPYDRTREHRAQPAQPVDWQIGVSRLAAPVAGEIVSTLTEAIDLWNVQPAGTRGLICMLDSMRYGEALTGPARIQIPERSGLTLIAADWPTRETDPGIFERVPGAYAPDRLRPHLRGNLHLEGTAQAESENPGAFHIEGFLIEGELVVLPGHLGQLTVAHCTLPAGLSDGLRVETAGDGRNSELKIRIHRSSLSRIECAANAETIAVVESFLGVPALPEQPALAAENAPISLERVTAWGTVAARQVDISESMLMGILETERTQMGCIRFSYLTPGSKAPRQFRCQPALAVAEAGAENDAALAEQIRRRVRPQFVSIDPADAAYGRLVETGPGEIREGGENGREMGVFAGLEEPARRRFLKECLDEFLRAGLAAGIHLVMTQPAVHYGHPQS